MVTDFEKTDLFAQVAKIISKQVEISLDTVKENLTFDDCGIDSLDMIEIIMKLEEHFSIEIKDEEVEVMKTVSDIVKTIQKKI